MYKDNSKHYKILDQLGNTHLVLKGTEIVGSYLYEPFGKQITLYESNSKDRMSFISKEKDIESELGDFGVRKYDYEIGRFTSIDPLWEKYYSWTPYHYCSNNPVMASDPSGLADYIYTSSDKEPTVENDWGWLEFLHSDNYYVEVNGKRYQANSKETVEQTDWTEVYENWETDYERGLCAKLNDALSGYVNGNYSPFDYALKESPEGGLMDQKHNLITKGGFLKDNAAKASLYVFQNKVYNWAEAGNIVWAQAMRSIGFRIEDLLIGAELYSIWANGRTDQNNEVKAIIDGYYGPLNTIGH